MFLWGIFNSDFFGEDVGGGRNVMTGFGLAEWGHLRLGNGVILGVFFACRMTHR